MLVDNKKIDEIELEFKKSEPLVVFYNYKINISNDAIKKNIPNKFYLHIFKVNENPLTKKILSLDFGEKEKKKNVDDFDFNKDIKGKFKEFAEKKQIITINIKTVLVF